jgi:hypothetical protein
MMFLFQIECNLSVDLEFYLFRVNKNSIITDENWQPSKRLPVQIEINHENWELERLGQFSL